MHVRSSVGNLCILSVVGEVYGMALMKRIREGVICNEQCDF